MLTTQPQRDIKHDHVHTNVAALKRDGEWSDTESSGVLFLTLEIIAGITCYVAANVFEPGIFSTGLVAICAISMIVMAVAGLYSFWSNRSSSF